jgi:hypothetical protein
MGVAMSEQTQDATRRAAIVLTAAVLVVFAVAFLFYNGLNLISNPLFGIDFIPYHLAGRLLATGDLAPLTNYAETGGFFADRGPFLTYFREFYPGSTYATRWVYLPAYVWIFRPLADLDLASAARTWLGVNALLSLSSVWLLWRARPLLLADRYLAVWRLAWFAFLGMTFQPMLSNLWLGQVTGLIFACFCLSYWLWRRGHPFGAGLVLGLIVPLKFYPILFVLYAVWRGKWRVVLGALVSSVAIVAASVLTAGWAGTLEYFQAVWIEARFGAAPAYNNQSIAGFLLHSFTQGDVFNWLGMSLPPWLAALRWTMALALVGVTLWAMRRRPTDTPDPDSAEDLDLALVILVMLLVSPITWYHYYMWLLLPIVVLFDHLLLSRKLIVRHIVWLVVGYGLVVVEGIVVIRPFAEQALQESWWLRIMLSQSFFGAVVLTILTLRYRLAAGRRENEPRPC